MTTLKYRRIGVGAFEGKEEVCEFQDIHAGLVPGAMCASEITEKGARSIIERWNKGMRDCWRYELVTDERPRYFLRAPQGDVTLTELKLGDREGGYQDIDALNHPGIAQVVVRLDGMSHDYEPGAELAVRIVALPKLIAALQDIGGRADMSVYDMASRARAALNEAGLSL